MQYPLIDKDMLVYLRLLHGIYNTGMLLLFVYQGWLGITIWRARHTKLPPPFPEIKRHRRYGPVLVIMGSVGFSVGLTLVLLDTGRILEYPYHFFTGLVIVILLIATWILSRMIRGPASPYRLPHFIVGVTILCLYFIEAGLGLGVLF
jgi:hypothetical protein